MKHKMNYISYQFQDNKEVRYFSSIFERPRRQPTAENIAMNSSESSLFYNSNGDLHAYPPSPFTLKLR